MIQKTSDYEREVKDKLLDITDLLYEKALACRREDYRRMKEELLLQEKNMLKKKVDYGGIKMGKRSNQQKNFMKQIVGLMKENKENELEDQESESYDEQED